jgi:hypothetical protein
MSTAEGQAVDRDAPVPADKVRFLCLTTKRYFLADQPRISRLSNGRYGMRVKCPWRSPKTGAELVACKFARKKDWEAQEHSEASSGSSDETSG